MHKGFKCRFVNSGIQSVVHLYTLVKTNCMSKGKDSKKSVKTVAAKTPKEKKAEKALKKLDKSSGRLDL